MNKKARQKAWEILVQVFQNQGFSNVLLNKITQQKFEISDKNLIFNLVHGTITYQIYLAYVTKKLIKPQKTPFQIQVLLWMSLYQLHFLTKIPPYAVVNEAVEIAKKVAPQLAGLVNATLKNVIQHPEFFQVDDLSNPEQKFCLEAAFPWTLYQKIKADYNQQVAKNVVVDSLKKPTISWRINSLKISHEAFLQSYWDEKTMVKSPMCVEGVISTVPVIGTNLYQEGLITVQDQASILVGEIVNPQPGSRVLDMCSAPGGKLTHLAALMKNTGEIVACEIKTQKIVLIQENLQRLGVKNVTLINQDALKIADSKQFDTILLDAPCSGIGVLKRKPEIKLNFSPANLAALTQLQAKLLLVAYQNLKKGGFLTYSTCTINRQENQDQIQQFVADHSDLNVVFEQQIFGYENNSDGFYICKLQKIG